MQKPLDPMSVERARTPPASYVLRRRYGPARHIIAVASWVTVINMLLQPVAVLAATAYWDSNGVTAGAGTTPSGTWGTSAFWTTDSTGASATGAWTSSDDAVFSAGTDATGSPTITINGTQTANGITIQEGALTFSGGTALQIGTGGLTLNSGMGAITISTPVTLGGAQSWTHSDDSLLTVQTGALSLGANQLTLNIGSTGGITISSAIGGTGSIVKSGAGTGTLTLSSTTSTFSGGTMLTSGTLHGSVAAAFGTGTLTLSGGKLYSSASTIHTIALTIDGSPTIELAGGNGSGYEFSGTATFASGVGTVTVNRAAPGGGFAWWKLTGDINLNTDFALAGALNAGAAGDSQIYWAPAATKNMTWTANRTITFNSLTGGDDAGYGGAIDQAALVIRGNLSSANWLKFTGTLGNRIQIGDSAANKVTGATGGIIIDGPTTVFGSTDSTFTGGVQIRSGTTYISASSTGTPVTKGPLGLGALTLSGGTLREDNVYTVGNDLTVNANSEIKLYAGNSGYATLSGPVTFASGLTTLTVNRKSAAADFHALQFTGQINLNTDFTLAGDLSETVGVNDGGSISFAPAAGNTIAWSSNRILTVNATRETKTGHGSDPGHVLTLAGALAGSNNTLTFAGTGSTTAPASYATISVGTLTGASGGIIANMTGANSRIFFGGVSTYTGGTTLRSGTISINVSSTPTVGPFYTGGSGPLGVGTFTIDAVSTVLTSAAVTIANDLAINTGSTVTFTPTTSLTINGQNQSIAGTPTLSFTAVTTTFGYYPMALNSDVTISGAGAATLSGGLTVGGAAGTRTITNNMGGILTISGPLTLNKNLTIGGTHTPVITMTGITETIVGSGGITLAFSDANSGNGLTTYTTGPLLLGGDFTLSGNSNKKPAVTLNGIRVPTGISSALILDDNNFSSLGIGSGVGKEIVLNGDLSLSRTSANVLALASALRIYGTGGLTLLNRTTQFAQNAANGVTYLYSGTITVGSEGYATTVKSSEANANELPSQADFVLANTTELQTLDTSKGYQIGSLAGAGTNGRVTRSGVAGTLIVGNAKSTTFAGSLGVGVVLTKVGSGTMTLTNANAAYDGTTTVRRGGLTFSGAAGAITGSAVVVDSGLLTLDNSGGAWADRLGDAKTISLGSLTLTSYNGAGIRTEQTGTLTLAAPGTITVTNGTTGGDRTSLYFTGTPVRGAVQYGSAVNFAGTTGQVFGTGSTDSPNVYADNAWPNARGTAAILPYATVDNTGAGTTIDWAVDTTATKRYIQSYITAGNTYTALPGITGNSATNYRVQGSGPSVTGGIAANSLKIEATGNAQSLDLNGQTLTLTGSANVGSAVLKTGADTGANAYEVKNGAIAPSAGTELIVHSFGDLLISANLNASFTSFAKGGSGKLTLTGTRAATFSGASGIAGTLELGGSTDTTISGAITGPGALIANLAANSNTLTLSGASTYAGGTDLKKGTLIIGVSGTPAFVAQAVSGPLGTGLLSVTGDGVTVRSSGAFTIANDLAINTAGTVNFGAAAGGGNFGFYGPNLSISSNPILAFTTNTATFYGTMTLNSGATLQGASGGATFSGGLKLATVSPTLTFNVSPTYTIAGGQLSSTTAGNKLAIAGTGNVTFGYLVSGLNEPVLEFNGSGVYSFTGTDVSYSTYGGGTTLTAGTLALGASSTGTSLSGNDPSPGVVYGPVGTGTLTLNGGTLRCVSTTGYILHNTLAISGNVTLGDLVNNGGLTFRGASQTIPGGVTVTALSAVTFGIGLTIGNGVNFYGPGLVTLQPQTVNSSSSNPVIIGDNSTFSGNLVGGNVSVGSQAALGSGTVTINYGGTLASTYAGTLSNTIYVNAGGTFSMAGAYAYSGVTIGSMGTLTGTANTAFAGTWPKKGVILVNIGTTSASALGPMEGTLAIGGTGALTITPQVTLSNPADTARTLAFNATAVTTFSNGLALNANLTVAGSSTPAFTGVYSGASNRYQPSSNLGTVTETGGARSVTVAMVPTGVITVPAPTSLGQTGGTRISGGTLFIVAGGAGANAITLDGGNLRVQGSVDFGQTFAQPLVVAAGGGALETGSSGDSSNYGQTTFSGNITKSGAGAVLTIRSNNTRGMVLSGDNRAFDAGFSLSAISEEGWIQFNGVNSTGSDGSGSAPNTSTANIITVPNGVLFGFNAGATFTSTINRFSTSSGAVLMLNNLGDIDLSTATGVNKDVRLGNNSWTATTYSGTITPFGSTYKFTPVTATAVAGLTLNTLNQLVDSGGARNLDVAAGSVINGAATVVGGTLAITAAQSYTGTTTVQGTIKNALMGGGVAGPTLTIAASGDLSGTTGITLDKSATMNVSGGVANYGRITAANVPITVKGGGILGIGDTTAANNNGVSDRIATTADLTLGGDTGGGTLTMRSPAAANMHAQTLDILTIACGTSTINASAATGTLNLTFTGDAEGYIRTVGGMANYVPTGFSTTKFSTAPSGTSIIGGILVGTTYNGVGMIAASNVNWAEPGYTTKNDPDTWATGENVNNNAAYSGTLTANRNVNSVKSVSANAGTINLGTNILTIESGMLVHSPNVGLTIRGSAGTPTDGELRTSNGQDLVLYVGANTVTISSKIGQQGGTTTRALTKAGAGTVTLANASNSIGDIYIHGGTVLALNGSTGYGFRPLGDLSVAKTVYFFGGTLQIYPDAATLANNTAGNMSMVVGPQGGTVTLGSTAGGAAPVIPLTYSIGTTASTAVTLNGSLALNPGYDDKTLLKFNSDITGPGQLIVTTTHQARWHIIELGGNNVNWTGGISLNANPAHLRIASANATGGGPIVIGTHGRGVTFTSGAGASYANDFQVNNVWGYFQNWKTDGAVSLTGKIIGPGGLLLQGHDATVNPAIPLVSETVLAGTVSMSGTPLAYGYGNATVIQNFINGQSGITLGATDRTSLSGASTIFGIGTNWGTSYGGGLLQYDSITTLHTVGAEGYVRFSGINSLIPGAVGPGYLAALRKGGADGSKKFGYLLTGTSGAGTEYVLPEGKSFLIGTLGSGASQTNGTFGVAGGGVATFLGNRKLAGAECGDINIHANAVSDVQTNCLLARAAADVLKLGNSATNVVFTPTYGDSGASSAITLMRDRTGSTTLLKVGQGTTDVVNAAFSNTNGACVKGSFSLIVSEGTLRYGQTEAGTYTNFASVAVNSGGQLYIGMGGTTGALPQPITDDGAVLFSRSDTLTHPADITGSGAVTNLSGTTILTGTNTYSGGTTIKSGSTLQLGNGGTGGTIAGDVVDDGTLVFNHSDDISFAGAISGSGALTKQGAGKLTLASKTYTGMTTVNAGILAGSGSLAGAMTVNAGGTNEVTGTTGARTVTGFTMTGGALNVSLDENNAGKVVVTGGSVALGSGVAALNLDVTEPPLAVEMVLIDNQGVGTVSGNFNGLLEGAALLLSGRAYRITYKGGDGNDVTLRVAPGGTVILFR